MFGMVMSDNADVVDYIKEVRMILADSIDTLLNLQHDLTEQPDDIITPITSVVELVDMSYDVSYDSKIRCAQEEFIKRDAL